MSSLHQISDSRLVQLSVAGDVQAFEEIVRRNISSMAAVAYALTGDMTTSEDVSQEVFLKAWQRLKDLREPERLRSWLCAIARNIARTCGRKAIHDPLRKAMELTSGENIHAASPTPVQHAIEAEKRQLVWSALERIPENYRLPMVLFYREGCSAAQVAEALDLTEETVRQRLRRARTLLKDEVAQVVETTISSCRPSPLVVTAIMAGIAGGTLQAAAATTTATAVVKGASASTALAGAAAGSFLGPILGIAAGFAGGIIGARASVRTAQTPAERALIVRLIRQLSFQCALMVLVILFATFAGVQGWLNLMQALLAGGTGVFLCIILMVTTSVSHLRNIIAVTGRRGPALKGTPLDRHLEFIARISTHGPANLIVANGGGVFGAVSWLLVKTSLRQEKELFGLIMAAASAAMITSVVCTMRRPANYLVHLAMTLLSIVVLYWAVAFWWWSTDSLPAMTNYAPDSVLITLSSGMC